MSEGTQRRLAAIVAADVVGYSRLMGADETGTLAAFRNHLSELIDPLTDKHGGRIVKTTGDGLLLEFPSVVAAVEFSIATQKGIAERNKDVPDKEAMRFRIGVHVGDIIIEGDDIFGDGVNIAARIEPLAEPDGVSLSDDAYRQVRDRLDVTWQDGGEKEVKNIVRPIRVWHWLNEARQPKAPVERARLAPPNKPSIAVLPFDNMSGDPEQEYFADGITEDINTELSRYNELMVIARNSTAAYKSSTPDIRLISKELGVRHVLTGSIRRAGKRVRISAQLIDAQTGSHVWADRFDRDLEDIFLVQDEITAVIVNTLLGKLTHREYEHSLRERPETLDAYDHALRASVLLTNWDRDDNTQARTEAELAVALDPKFARAHAFLAWTYSLEATLRWVSEPKTSFEKGYEAAIRAVELDDSEPWAYAALGFSELWGKHKYERGIASLERAVSLNPNNAHFRVWLSNALCLAGRSEEGMVEIETAMRLNPNYPPIYLHFLARLLATLRRYSEALTHLERLVKIMPTSTNSLALYAACNAGVERMDVAESAVSKLRDISPTFSLAVVPDHSPYARREDLETYVGLLRKAGLPE